MDCNLLRLPIELQHWIVELLRDDDQRENEVLPFNGLYDLINWSCTCSYFRTLLAPDIFKACTLVNHEKSGSSLTTVANSPHSIHVKALHFIGYAIDDTHSEPLMDTERILPRSVDALLCNLHRFPRLEKLIIDFDYDSHNSLCQGPVVMDVRNFISQTPEEALVAEASSAWRALMCRTYSALTKNKSPSFRHLEIRGIFWHHVSTFSHAPLHDFLGHVEQFTLSTLSWHRFRYYHSQFWMLDHSFSNHLANVTTLNIKAPELKPPELGWRITILNLKPDRMPLLKTLHVDNIFATEELIHFLVGHKDTLEELTLRNCYASMKTKGFWFGGCIYWSNLFTSLFSACPTQLRRFKLVGNKINFLPSEKDFGEEANEAVRTRLRQDPGRILFPYAARHDILGTLFYNDEESLEQFLKGEDQQSWDRLMGLVEGNARKAAMRERKGVQLRVES